MQIFLSHSAQDGELAEQVHLALEELGHEVFFDRSSLPSGDSFNDKIRAALEECEVFVFLASRNSLREGSYCLTELKFIEQRWKVPRGRVLPVLIEPLAPRDLPPYLRAVTFLEVHGNVPAETAEAVARMLAAYERRRLVWIGGALAVAALVAGAFALQRGLGASAGPDDVHELAVQRARRELGALAGDRFEVTALVANSLSRPRTLTALSFELDRPGLALEVDAEGGAREEVQLEWLLSPGEAKHFRANARVRRASDGAALLESELGMLRWRARWRWHDGEQRLGAWLAWEPSGTIANAALHPLPRAIRGRARAVASPDGTRALIAAAAPCELLEVEPSGDARSLATLRDRETDSDPQPLALACEQDFAAVATNAARPLWLVHVSDGAVQGPFEVQTYPIPPSQGGGSFSTRARELALWQDQVWVQTGADDKPAMLTNFDPPNEVWHVPEHTFYDYAGFVDTFDAVPRLRFARIGETLWGVCTEKDDGRFALFLNQHDLLTFDGGNEQELFGARALTEGPGGTFVVVNGDLELVELARDEAQHFVRRRVLGHLELPHLQPLQWVDPRLASRAGRILLAVTIYDQDPRWAPASTRFSTWSASEPELRTLAVLEGFETLSLATGADAGWAVVRDTAGACDATRIELALPAH